MAKLWQHVERMVNNMTEYLFKLTFEDLDVNDCHDFEVNVSSDNYEYAWHSAVSQGFDFIGIKNNDGHSIELKRVEVISMFNPKI